MSLILIYLILVFILAALSLLVISNFWRYRFHGDRTGLVISLFITAFLLIAASGFLLVDPSALSSTSAPITDTTDFSS
jgi:hypothetical protein